MAQSVLIALDEPKQMLDVDRNPPLVGAAARTVPWASSPMALDDRIAAEVRYARTPISETLSKPFDLGDHYRSFSQLDFAPAFYGLLVHTARGCVPAVRRQKSGRSGPDRVLPSYSSARMPGLDADRLPALLRG